MAFKRPRVQFSSAPPEISEACEKSQASFIVSCHIPLRHRAVGWHAESFEASQLDNGRILRRQAQPASSTAPSGRLPGRVLGKSAMRSQLWPARHPGACLRRGWLPCWTVRRVLGRKSLKNVGSQGVEPAGRAFRIQTGVVKKGRGAMVLEGKTEPGRMGRGFQAS